MNRGRLVAVIALIAALGGLARPAKAEVIERVVAVVNDDAIFLSELRRRAAPFLERAMAVPTAAGRMAAIEQLYAEVLDRMVQEQLFSQAATEMQVTVSNAEVDRAIENVRTQARLDQAQFWQAVQAQGFSPEQYRTDVRRQLLRLKVLNHRARGRVNITEDQVRERYDMLVARERRSNQYRAGQIFFDVPAGSSATDIAAVRRRAEETRARIHDADGFWAEGGQSLGTLQQGSLESSLEDALVNLDVGEISGVVRGPAGFHVFLLEAREEGSANVPPYEQVRMQVYQSMMGEAMEHQEEIFIAELRRRATIDLRL